ncbi:hypothetical protein ACK4CS_07175 [Enterococcus gallinarum]|uniref:hypothetical protein n=1 Tax=Enterococcus gallinarum TaxID=1353 RepID=UPI001F570BA1|nr:hypothetical protein [Enterococcus gallinarum]MCR1926830.1 hypothetical protein [Enterococcus gallinarum]MCR1943437.1 hypothetical protein [Enterococcus gallinarum]
MKNKWASIFEKVLHVLWVAANLIFFTWVGYWFIGVLFILGFYLLYGLLLRSVSRMEKESYDERQNQLKSNSYKWGLKVGFILLFTMPGFFSNPSDFAFFLMGIVGSVIVGYQMLSGSFFGHNARKGEVYTILSVFLFIGAGGTFLYCRDMVIGSQKLVAAGRITIDSGFWLVLASLVISLTGWMYVFKERANRA